MLEETTTYIDNQKDEGITKETKRIIKKKH